MTFVNVKLAFQKPSAGADTEFESVASGSDDLIFEVPAELEIAKIEKSSVGNSGRLRVDGGFAEDMLRE